MELTYKQFTCIKSFDYLTAGEKYTVETSGKLWHFWDVERNCGTFIEKWMCESAIKNGYLV
jgi:hypothetical protein